MKDFLGHYKKLEKDRSFEKVYDTQCPFCSMQCKMHLHEEHIVHRTKYRVTPDKEDPVSQGRLCVKGMQAHQHALHKHRLLHPMVSVGGRWKTLRWQTAVDAICNKISSLQRKHGRDVVAVYGGGSLTNEVSYLLGKFARVALRTKYIDYNGRFCMSSAATAANQVFGLDRGLTNPLSEIPDAKCIILAGTNIAECQPTIMPYFRQAKKNGAVIITIDPRETLTAKISDIHLKVKPGTDAALANGMLKVIFHEKLEDKTFIQNRTKGILALKKHLSRLDLSAISEQTGVSEELIRQAARAYATAETGMVFTARGVEQHASGVKNVKNFLNLVLVTGKIGRRGCGYGAITGQGNGQGGREHGQKADQLPGYRLIENPEHRKTIADVWGIEESSLPRKGVSAYEMMERIRSGEIKALIVLGSNPVVSNPNSTWVEEGLKKLDYLVVIDLFMSETARMADFLLPGSSYLEDEGTMTNLEGKVIYRSAERPLPGEARQDWKILCDLAQGLGKGDKFSYQSAEDIFDELCRASKGGKADYSGMTYARLREHKGLHWPCRSKDDQGNARVFDDRFETEDEKAVLTPVDNLRPNEMPDDQYPLYLTTGRVMQHYLTGVQTRHTEELNKKYPEPLLEIHPDTAARYDIEDGAYVQLTSRRGEMFIKAKFSTAIREDTLFVPFHWGGLQCINRLTNPALDEQSRMPEFKVCVVKVKSLKALLVENEKEADAVSS